MRIVLADDHPFLRAGVEAVLTGSGIEVTSSVADGEAALAAIASDNPDVAVLDVRMPGMDGVEVLRAMREGGDQRPVVLLTAELEDAALLAAIKAKVNGIVFKQGAEGRLQEAIRTVAAGETYIDPEVVSRALALAIDSQESDKLASLSAREMAIAVGVSTGRRNREIAREEGMTEGSIRVYLSRIYDKLGIDNRTELAVMVLARQRR